MKYGLGSAALIGLGILASTALPARAELGLVGPTSPGNTVAPAALALCSTTTPCGPAFGSSAPVWSVASGGCGLRNRGDCSIDISAAKSPAQAAMVFWSIILAPGMSANDSRVSTLFVAHGELGATVQGSLIGTGPEPCWGQGTPIASYLGFLPLSIVNSESNPTPGNGLYHVFLQPGGSGSTSGADPWGGGSTVAPLAEGVSVVIFGTGNQKVAIWGGPGFTGATFAGGTQAYALKFAPLPNATAGLRAHFVSMFADGQVGGSPDGYSFGAGSGKAMIINGVNVAGLGSTINPTSGLNGDSAAPLPRLWDSTEINVGSMGVFNANQAQMNITVGGAANNDCITPIAHVMAY